MKNFKLAICAKHNVGIAKIFFINEEKAREIIAKRCPEEHKDQQLRDIAVENVVLGFDKAAVTYMLIEQVEAKKSKKRTKRS